MLAAVCERKSARALYIYPTKALAQDQARALRAYGLGLRPAVYDGDTPREQRHLVRRFANPILTNPDMLHVGVLPNHRRWADVLTNLTHVVIDEAHTYRGVFGSHVALVLRRLRRVCALYGCEPQFLLASATIANPARGLRRAHRPRRARRRATTAPRARRAAWRSGTRRCSTRPRATRGSALGEAAGLLAALTARGLRTICFVKSRKASELVFRFARESLISAGRDDVAERLAPYRAGYTAEERRRIEGDLVSGAPARASSPRRRSSSASTSGCSTARSPIGFPGTVASLRQQWGRAGRRGEGLALLIPGADALDRYFINHPEALLGRPNEAAILDPTNPEIRIGHLRAAAHELPLTEADDAVLGAGALSAAEALVEAGELVRTPARAGLARRRLARRARLAALGLGRRDRRRRAGDRHAARHARAGAGVLDGARGRGLPAPRRDLPGRDARPATIASRSSTPFDGALVHAAAPRDRDEHRARAGRARSAAAASSSATARSRSPTRSSPTSAAACPRARRLDTVPLDLPARQLRDRARSGSCRRTS